MKLQALMAALALSITSFTQAATLQVNPTTGEWNFGVGNAEPINIGNTGVGTNAARWGTTSFAFSESVTFSYTAIGSVSGNLSNTGVLFMYKDTSASIPATQLSFLAGFNGAFLVETLSDVVITATSNFTTLNGEILEFENFATLVAAESPYASSTGSPTNTDLIVVAVPEPTSAALLLGAAGLLALRSRVRR